TGDLGEAFDLAVAPSDDPELAVGRRLAALLPARRDQALVARHGAPGRDGHVAVAVAHRSRLSAARSRRWAAARPAASKILVYPVHRQRLPDSARAMSSRAGLALRCSRAQALMVMPGVQKPHCAPPVRSRAS